jgi:hypothetical protein
MLIFKNSRAGRPAFFAEAAVGGGRACPPCRNVAGGAADGEVPDYRVLER